MSNWVWLSRVMGLGLVGTAALAAVFFAIVGASSKPNSDRVQRTNEADRLQATVISPEERQVLELSAVQAPTPPIQGESLPQGNTSGKQDSVRANSNKAAAPKRKPSGSPQLKRKITAPPPPFDLKQSLIKFSPLFATPTSLGMVAIGVAEGNYRLVVKDSTLYVQQTPTYFGHTDPGNLSWGEVVTNFGPCSDQGRSGGNLALAEQMCLERSRSALPMQLVDLNAAGIAPNQDLEAVLNTADLYNQASPIHSRYFPRALTIARRGGLRGIDAIAWARTASFYLNTNNELDIEKGKNQATGLLGICIRERRPITEWQCVYDDQMRRVKAIADVLDQYRSLAQRGTRK